MFVVVGTLFGVVSKGHLEESHFVGFPRFDTYLLWLLWRVALFKLWFEWEGCVF